MIAPADQHSATKITGIGRIPSHWETRRLKRLASFAYGESLPADSRSPGVFPVYGSNGPVGYHATANTEAPCLIIGRKGSFGKVAYSAEPVWAIDTTYFVDPRCTSENLRWLYYVLSSAGLDATTKDATIPGLAREEAYEYLVPWCPICEQKIIASFLDRETSRIDSIIQLKQRQIELLEEKRVALISQTVTNGLDPNVKMKDSGVEWLGEIPEHWEVRRGRYLFTEFDSRSETGGEELLSVSHIHGVTRRSESSASMFLPESFEGYKKCAAGDLVVNTMWAWMGAMGIAPEPGIVSPSYNTYRFVTGDVDPLYYDMLVRTPQFAAEAGRRSTGVWTSRLRLYPEQLRSVRFPVPPLREQEAAVNRLKAVTSDQKQLLDSLSKSVELLNELRSSLISAAVTGQIDVRGEVSAP